MKKLLFILLTGLALFASMPMIAAADNDLGSYTYTDAVDCGGCDLVLADNSYTQYGNSIYGSDGYSATRIGNTVYDNQGNTYSRYGNTTYGSDGSSYTRYGNTTYDNSGGSVTTYGNTSYGSDGSSCTRYGNTMYCQ